MQLSDTKFIASLCIGELLRCLEHRIVGPEVYLKRRAARDEVYGSVLIDAAGYHRRKLIAALEVLRACCPATEAWLQSSIGVIKTTPQSSFTGGFHFAGPLVAVSGAEIDFCTEDLACVLGRRIALSRLLRAHFMLPPCVVMRAQVFVLLLEERLARRLPASPEHYEKTLRRIESWQDLLERWGSHRKIQLGRGD